MRLADGLVDQLLVEAAHAAFPGLGILYKGPMVRLARRCRQPPHLNVPGSNLLARDRFASGIEQRIATQNVVQRVDCPAFLPSFITDYLETRSEPLLPGQGCHESLLRPGRLGPERIEERSNMNLTKRRQKR